MCTDTTTMYGRASCYLKRFVVSGRERTVSGERMRATTVDGEKKERDRTKEEARESDRDRERER